MLNQKVLHKLIEIGNFESIPGHGTFTKELTEVINSSLEKLDARTDKCHPEFKGYRIDDEGLIYEIEYDKAYLYGNKSTCFKNYDYAYEG